STDLKELTVQLCAHMLELSGLVKNLAAGRKLALARLADGSAWKVFQDLVREQNGSLSQILNPELLPVSPKTVQWTAKKRAYTAKMDTEALGRILVELGGGRKKASDIVDPSVGMLFHKKLGARVEAGEPIVTVHIPEKLKLDEIEAQFHQAIEITGARKP